MTALVFFSKKTPKKKEFSLIIKVHTFTFLIKALFSGYTYIQSISKYYSKIYFE